MTWQAWRGLAFHGPAWQGAFWLGKAWQVRLGLGGFVGARHGMVRQAWQGWARGRRGRARCGVAGMAWIGSSRQGVVRQFMVRQAWF